MHSAFCNHSDDVKWLNETALKGVPIPKEFHDFKSFTLTGNEDAPDSVELFLTDDPTINDKYLSVKFRSDGSMVYCEYDIVGG